MRTISGKSTILSTASEYLHDESRFQGGIPQTICFPESVRDVQKIVSQASSSQTQITFLGSRTGTTGGATCTDGSIAVSFSSMNHIISAGYNTSGSVVLECEPGVTLSTINSFLTDPSSHKDVVPGSNILGKNCFFFPPDPTETSAQLGGMVSTNASGARSYRFGAIRPHVASVKIVISNGEQLSISRGQYKMRHDGFHVYTDSGNTLHIPPLEYKSPSTKNAAGYFCKSGMDFIDLIIGSEGTLGAIVQIGIILQLSKNIISGLSFFPSREAAFDFTDVLRSEKSILSIEYFDSTSLDFINLYRERFSDWLPSFPGKSSSAILWEWSEHDPLEFESCIETFESYLVDYGSSLDLTWSGFNESEQFLLKRFRHALPETINSAISHNKVQNPDIHKIGTDTAVPPLHFRDVTFKSIEQIEKHAIQYAIFGHIGDYHLHINLLPSTQGQLQLALVLYEELMDMAIDCGGTVSAEHGIGKIKRKFLKKMYNQHAMDQMLAVKYAFDPLTIFNSGNLL